MTTRPDNTPEFAETYLWWMVCLTSTLGCIVIVADLAGGRYGDLGTDATRLLSVVGVWHLCRACVASMGRWRDRAIARLERERDDHTP